MNIFLVDDNDTFRQNLKLFIEEHLLHKVCDEASDGKSFLQKKTINADIVLMDINMPELNGMEAAKLGTWINNKLKIIAVTQYMDMADLEQIIGAGFKGFVSKTNLFRDLGNALEVVMNGGYFFPEELEIKNSEYPKNGK
jgi:DNA-binding NarL/FixJ family response regulator